MVDKDDIIRMALKAGASQAVSPRNPDRPAHSFSMKHLECFAELIAAHERRACGLIVLDNSDSDGICCTDDVLEAFRQRGKE
jgi:hypothetical protein